MWAQSPRTRLLQGRPRGSASPPTPLPLQGLPAWPDGCGRVRCSQTLDPNEPPALWAEDLFSCSKEIGIQLQKRLAMTWGVKSVLLEEVTGRGLRHITRGRAFYPGSSLTLLPRPTVHQGNFRKLPLGFCRNPVPCTDVLSFLSALLPSFVLYSPLGGRSAPFLDLRGLLLQMHLPLYLEICGLWSPGALQSPEEAAHRKDDSGIFFVLEQGLWSPLQGEGSQGLLQPRRQLPLYRLCSPGSSVAWNAPCLAQPS